MIVSLSILSAPLLDLSETISRMVDCGVDRLHLDIMDGHYVPRIAFGLDWVAAIHHRFPKLPLDVHFMIQPLSPERHKDCRAAGAERLWLHEATVHDPALRAQHSDWVLSLHENLSSLPSTLGGCLVMAVIPGAGGQALQPQIYSRIRAIKQQMPGVWVAVDGGVNEQHIPELKEAGVDEVIMGHGLIHALNPKAVIDLAHAAL